jgi:membrane protein
MKGFFRHYFGGLYHRFGEHNVFLLAGGLAFSFLVCMVPLALVIFYALGSMLAASTFAYHLDVVVNTLFPYSQYAEPLKAFLISRLEEIVTYKNVAGSSGAFGLVLAASGLFSSMRTILNKVFKVSIDKPIVVGKLRDFGMVLLVLLFFLISMAIPPLLEIVQKHADKTIWLKSFRFIASLPSLFPVFVFAVIFCGFYVLYYFVPYVKVGRIAAGLSALVAAVFWEIAKELFGYYLTNFATLDRIYGAYIFIVVSVVWIYYSSLVFILGAEIGQLYRERASSVESGMEIQMGRLDS